MEKDIQKTETFQRQKAISNFILNVLYTLKVFWMTGILAVVYYFAYAFLNIEVISQIVDIKHLNELMINKFIGVFTLTVFLYSIHKYITSLLASFQQLKMSKDIVIQQLTELNKNQ